jgi:hypothetical protein
MGGLNNTLGELSESLFAAGLREKFNERGFTFTKSSHRTIFAKGKRTIAEAGVSQKLG